MQLFNNVLYDGTQVSSTQYTLTVRATFETVPTDAKSVVMSLQDGANKAARVLMDSSGNTFTITHVFTTTETDNSIPEFDNGSLTAMSSDVAEVLNRPLLTAIVNVCGQSNGTGKNNGKANFPAWLFQEIDSRIKQSNFNQASRYSEFHKVPAVEPLFHPIIETNVTLGPGIPFAQNLLTEGWNEVLLLPNCASGIGIQQFINGGTYYQPTIDSIVEAINDSPFHSFAGWYWAHGEANQNSMAATTYRDNVLSMYNDMSAAVLAQTGVDIKRGFFIAMGMGKDYRDTGFYDSGINMETGIADLVNVIPFSAYVEIGNGFSGNGNQYETGDSATDFLHHSAEGCVRLGKMAFDAVAVARANFWPGGTDPLLTALNLNATAPNLPLSGSTASLVTSGPLNLNATAPNLALSGSTANLYTNEPLILNATASNLALSGSTASLETTTAGPDITNTLSFGPAMVFRADSGVQTDASGNVTQWDDLSTNNRHLTPKNGNCTTAADAVVFGGAANLQNLTGGITTAQGQGAEYAVIVEFNGSAGQVFEEDTPPFGVVNLNIDSQTAEYRIAFSGHSLTATGVDLDDGSDHVVAIVKDGDGTNALKYYTGTRGGGLSLNKQGNFNSEGASTPKTTLGSGADDTLYLTGQIKRYVVYDSVTLSLANLNTIVAEF